ncbi:uncharacterized protein ACLA_061760 [Aspergillus clavatus NRRL 1]|uniref:Uncharacterized protein n=1 Tax=Aspergillus clavatus (strain ATCC 1007 / CBS 513.65 / DSM 816 / NCTC 3887 / NRRL 1 / QM 1276 / 107) TaxID=344612 RepID=A1CCF7_ASPCL|nr:uncharacterized protein ACLA_061760 [Aspergillus clavatus NRRL 1]EAW12214.1 conserved hypothetical protein [Aspergillus clavatus NRRL 1]
MQCSRSGSSTPMGRDPDSRWVQWLALTRRNNPTSLSGTVSSCSSTSSLPINSSNLSDSGRLRSRSSATSYFALLSAADAQDARAQHHHAHKHSGSGTGPRYMDSSWVAWFNERGQRQDMTDEPLHTTHPFHAGSNTYPESSLQMQAQSYLPETTTGLPPSAFLNPTTTPSAVSSICTATPFPSPLAGGVMDTDMDALQRQFADYPPFPVNFTDGVPPFDPAELDAGLLTWLDEQHAFAFSVEEPAACPGKRSLEGFPADVAVDHTGKKQKVYHGGGAC